MSTAEEAAKAGATAAGITGTVVATAAAVAPAATAAAAFGISTAIGTAIPIPLLGTAIGAVVGAFTALGVALASIGRDSFKPNALQAAGWLLLFQICPGLLFAGIDTITTDKDRATERASRLVRYLRLVSGIVPMQQGWELYNPNDFGSKSNPYMESKHPDPGDPLTDHRIVKMVFDMVHAAGGDVTSPKIPPMFWNKAHGQVGAQATLAVMRQHGDALGAVLGGDQIKAHLPGIRAAIGHIRSLAGEQGHDPVLARLLGGPVDPTPPTWDAYNLLSHALLALYPSDPKLHGPGHGHGGGHHFEHHHGRHWPHFVDEVLEVDEPDWIIVDRIAPSTAALLLASDMDSPAVNPEQLVTDATGEGWKRLKLVPRELAPPGAPSSAPTSSPTGPPAAPPAPLSPRAMRPARPRPHSSPWPFRLAVGGIAVAAVGGGVVWYRHRAKRATR
jgi:hypothetical protein